MLTRFIAICYCALSALVAAFAASVPEGEISDNPTPTNFLRRAFHGSTVLGNFVYIDGGEFSQLVDGYPDPGENSDANHTPHARQNNVTLTIDLRHSWTNASLIIHTVSQGSAPVLNYEEYWIYPDGKSFYLWNGELSALTTEGTKTNADSLWKFTSDGTGNGTWSEEPINYTTPSSATGTSQNLFRPGNLGCSTTIGDTGYHVGGRIWDESDVDASPTGYFQNTITSFNMSSGVWSNDLNTSIGSVGTVVGASAGSITALGLDGRGLLVLIGGRDPGTNVTAPPTNYYELSNVTLYDPYIDVWYAQQASGDIPSPREQFCTVIVPGDNGTYEIFLYGGLNLQNMEDWAVSGEVYVLSIPGFVWFKLSGPTVAPARYAHTCELVGGRQLLSIGGLDNPQSEPNIYFDFTIPDPFTQGIGIFDMTDLVWKTGYDADEPPYQTPQIVKDWYAAGNQASVPWQSLELARMFIRDTPVSVFPTPTATSSGTTGTAAAGQSNNDKIGNRIGLGVGIGIGLPSLIGALWSSWLTWRTYQLKRSKKSHKMPSSESPPASEVAVPASPHPQATPPDEHSTNTPSCESSQRLNILVSQP